MKYLIIFQLNCCGAQEYMDWKNTTFSQVTAPDSVPDSCCIHDAEDCGKGILKVPDEVILDIMIRDRFLLIVLIITALR